MAHTVPFTTTAIIPIMTACIGDTAEVIGLCIRRDMANTTTEGRAVMVTGPRIPESIKTQRNSLDIS